MTELLTRLLAGLSIVASIALFALGIWNGDGRWYGLGFLFAVVFVVAAIVAYNTRDTW